MNRKKTYKDLEKYANTKRGQQKRYRERTGAFMYRRRMWTEKEIDLLLAQDMTDRELSKIIHRSIGAIQTKRAKLRVKGEINGEESAGIRDK